MATKEQTSGSKASDKKSQHKQPEIELDQNEYEVLMAAESVQRFMDGHQPALTPAHVLALQRKVGNTAVQRLISQQRTAQPGRDIERDLAPNDLVPDVSAIGDAAPEVQQQGGEGAGGGSSVPGPETGGGSGSGPGTDPEGGGPVEMPAEGPPMKFTLAGAGINVSLEGGEVSVGYTVDHDVISKTVGPLFFPLASGVGIVMSASLDGGVSAGGSIKASMDEEKGPPPMAPETMRETATIGGTIEFKISITGELFFGVGVGVQAVNFATGIAGSLEFSDSFPTTISGSAIRHSYPEDGGQSAWDEWSGEVTLKSELRSDLIAYLKAVGRWHLFSESGDWFVVDIGNWPIYQIYSVGTTTYGLPDGDVTKSLEEGVKFLGVPMQVAESGSGQPPWTHSRDSSGGPAPPDEGMEEEPAYEPPGGTGGSGPAPAEEITAGEDIMSSGEGGAGGMGGASQEEGMLSGGGEGGASQEEVSEGSVQGGQSGTGGTGGSGGASQEEGF